MSYFRACLAVRNGETNLVGASAASPEDEQHAHTPDDTGSAEEESWDPNDRKFGAGVSRIRARWQPLYFSKLEGDGSIRAGRRVDVVFPIGTVSDLKRPSGRECLRKCKVKTETSGVFAHSCNGGLNWKALVPGRQWKQPVSFVHHRPHGRGLPSTYVLCCDIVPCDEDSWKVNYEIYSPMHSLSESIERDHGDKCLCCTHELQTDKLGFHYLGDVVNSCKLAFTLRTSIGDVNGMPGYSPDSQVRMTVASEELERRCGTYCWQTGGTYRVGQSRSKLAI